MILRPDESGDPWQGRLAAAVHARRAIARTAADVRLDGVPVVAKAQALLMQRQVIPAADSELDPDAFAAWFREAVTIQEAIYRIDLYYEGSARIEAVTEAPLWSAVERLLCVGLAAASPHIWAALEDLRRYADAERRVHTMDPIDFREFGTILSLKCADVRIARTLIWSYTGRALGAAEIAFWSLYDQCWELIEDFEDLDEDGKDWNFNFWLYPFRSGRSAIAGVESVAGLLRRKLVELRDVYQRLPSSAMPRYQGRLARTLSTAKTVERRRGRVFAAIAGGNVTPFAERLCCQRPTHGRAGRAAASAWGHSDGR
jgi:hypothetical protein